MEIVKIQGVIMIWKTSRRILTGENVLLVSVTLILALIILEILTRTFFPNDPPLFIASDDPQLIYELNPQHLEINSLGMRQTEFDPSTLHDQFVIAVIGDSHTYSVKSTNRENSFPARLEHHLRVLSGQNVKVLNLGVPGYNMHQELEVLRVKAMPFRPNLVILQYCINDEHISNYIQPKYIWLNRAIHKSEFLSRALIKLVFWRRFIVSAVGKHFPDMLLFSPGLVGTPRAHDEDPAHGPPHPPRTRDQVPVRYWDFIGRKNLERDVKAFGVSAKDAGIHILATGFIEDRDRNLYEESGFQAYSFFQIFRGLDMRDYGYDPADTANHFSDNGSDFIGNAIAGFVYAHYPLLATNLASAGVKPK
jgi:lysophospholipase L1-like esterase